MPENGTPDYVIESGDGGSYAVFLKDITRAEGEEYLRALEEAGYTVVQESGEGSALGALMQKDQVYVAISACEGGLGLYLSVPENP